MLTPPTLAAQAASTDIDYSDFEPIIDPDQFPEAFGGAPDRYLQAKCLCPGDGRCHCFELLQDRPRHQMTLRDMLEGELEEKINSFTTKDNNPGIGESQIEENSSEGGLYNISAPKTSADKQLIESPLTSATMECDTERKGTSDGLKESASTSSEYSVSNNAEDGVSARTEQSDSTATENNIPGVGKFRIEETSSEHFLCGMYALEISTNKQLAGDTLTPAAFKDIFRYAQAMQALNRRKGWQNRNEFHDEQLACVLRIWGRQNGYNRLQLGLIAEGGTPFILGAYDKVVPVDSEAVMENELNQGFTTIWIHNNNITDRKGAAINHYSGVTLLDTVEEKNEARRVKAAQKMEEAAKRREIAEKQEAVEKRLEAMRKPPKGPREPMDFHQRSKKLRRKN